MQAERKIAKQFDQDEDKRLSKEERAAAREFIKQENAKRPRGFGPGGMPGFPPGGPGGFGGPPGFGGNQEPPKPGIRLTPADVAKPASSNLYAQDTLRTLFFDFEGSDWEQELSDFHNTDVEVPATLTVDGEKLEGVGVHFRGASSYMMVREGRKRSLNVEIDYTKKKQRLDGYKTLNLLNSNGDASMMSTVLYSQIASNYLPTPKANFVRVVINGENWGVYVNVQQFNKDFLQEHFRTEKGARWKVKGSPGGGGGLDYIGDDIAEYRKRYELKTDEDEDDWKALIGLCKMLHETPADQLESKLREVVDVDSLLWFLALDCALINSDGYWVRASDFSIYRDKAGIFHFIPHDMNESFTIPRGPGMGGQRRGRGENRGDRPPEGLENARPGGNRAPEQGGTPRHDGPKGGSPEVRPDRPPQFPPDGPPPGGFPGGDAGGPPRGFGPGGMPPMPAFKGIELDPLVGMDDARKPLRSKVLAVPSLRTQYLRNVRTIADEWLDWKKLGPIVAKYRSLIEKDVEIDTRKLSTIEAFRKATADAPSSEAKAEEGRRMELSLREFADQRRAYLLQHPEIQKLPTEKP